MLELIIVKVCIAERDRVLYLCVSSTSARASNKTTTMKAFKLSSLPCLSDCVRRGISSLSSAPHRHWMLVIKLTIIISCDRRVTAIRRVKKEKKSSWGVKWTVENEKWILTDTRRIQIFKGKLKSVKNRQKKLKIENIWFL